MYRLKALENKLKLLCLLRSDSRYCIALKGFTILESGVVDVELLKVDCDGNYMVYTTQYPIDYIEAL